MSFISLLMVLFIFHRFDEIVNKYTLKFKDSALEKMVSSFTLVSIFFKVFYV